MLSVAVAPRSIVVAVSTWETTIWHCWTNITTCDWKVTLITTTLLGCEVVVTMLGLSYL